MTDDFTIALGREMQERIEDGDLVPCGRGCHKFYRPGHPHLTEEFCGTPEEQHDEWEAAFFHGLSLALASVEKLRSLTDQPISQGRLLAAQRRLEQASQCVQDARPLRVVR